jgi:hypothetical protein
VVCAPRDRVWRGAAFGRARLANIFCLSACLSGKRENRRLPRNYPARYHDPGFYPFFAIAADLQMDRQTWQIVGRFREPPAIIRFGLIRCQTKYHEIL